ncbi:MAG: lipid-A-disaccharide synthase [Gammaproteobacteria bacterium]
MVRIGIVAGEASGDQLAAGLIEAVRARVPDARFEGIAGPAMVAAGCAALYPSEKLAVMGLVEVLGHLPELLRIRWRLFRYFRSNPPDVFIGVDAPDFNLGLEGRLRAAGIRTVHYVSPSVWAWRQKRVRKIARNVDLMLTLFPFEAEFYRRHGVAARFVGHPFADAIPQTPDRDAARRTLGATGAATVVALLPGSRMGEVRRLAEPFLRAAALCHARRPELRFVAPMVNTGVRARFDEIRGRVAPQLPLTLVDGQARTVLAASDVVLVASGTAALEAMFMKRPMVVAYRLSPVTYAVLRLFRLLKVRHYALPNLLAGREVVRELMQGDATADRLAQELLLLLDDPARRDEMHGAFEQIHQSLRRDANERAADAVVELLAAGTTAATQ